MFAVGVLAEHIRFDGGHFHLHVDAIEQRAGDAALVALDQIRRTIADAADMAVVAARTGIHRRDQLEVRREVGLPRGARDGDVAGLHRLAQHVEHAAVEFRKFVEEENTAMRQRNLAGARHTAVKIILLRTMPGMRPEK